jgi:hypothetical protein
LDTFFKTLQTASRDDLIDRWRVTIGRPAPKHISRSLLISIIAFEHQAQRHGRPTQRFLQALERRVNGKADRPKLTAGTRFVREHHGKTHLVEVNAAGAFVWQEAAYTSLSQVAKQICGYHCSGNKFFGVPK